MLKMKVLNPELRLNPEVSNPCNKYNMISKYQKSKYNAYNTITKTNKIRRKLALKKPGNICSSRHSIICI